MTNELKEKGEDMKSWDDMIQKNHENKLKLIKESKFKYNFGNDLKPLQKVKYEFNVSNIAKGWGIKNEAAVLNNLNDGRSVSWWLEPIVVEYFGMLDNGGDKNELYDAITKTEKNGMTTNLFVGIKSLTSSGLDLMQSSFKGRGLKNITREKRVEALVTSIELCSYHIITDIVDAPILYFIPVTSEELVSKFTQPKCSLAPSRAAFYKMFFGKTLKELIENNEFVSIR
jgi:hypothetical protein